VAAQLPENCSHTGIVNADSAAIREELHSRLRVRQFLEAWIKPE